MHSSLNKDDRNLQYQAWILCYGSVKKLENNLKQTISDGDCQNRCCGAMGRCCWKRGFKQKLLSRLEKNRITQKHTHTHPTTNTHIPTQPLIHTHSQLLIHTRAHTHTGRVYQCNCCEIIFVPNRIQVVLGCHGKCEPTEPRMLES